MCRDDFEFLLLNDNVNGEEMLTNSVAQSRKKITRRKSSFGKTDSNYEKFTSSNSPNFEIQVVRNQPARVKKNEAMRKIATYKNAEENYEINDDFAISTPSKSLKRPRNEVQYTKNALKTILICSNFSLYLAYSLF